MNGNHVRRDCWFLSGPTASGKTSIGIELARQLGAEIVALDSMTVYRHMNIGTAKPTAEDRSLVPHHLIDVVNPNEPYNIYCYLEAAHQIVKQIHRRGNEVLFVGGTPLYLKALLRGLFQGPEADWKFREKIVRETATIGKDSLYQRVLQVDPLSASRLHPNDTRRLIRALEVYKLTGQPISHLQLQFEESRPAEQCRVFVLERPKSELTFRMDHRVDWMFRTGLLEETKALTESETPPGQTARQAVGYREALAHLAGELSRVEAINRVKIRTRRFGKRQKSWFRALRECRPVQLDRRETPRAVAQRIMTLAP